jgi:4-amino-4-deoxy-L-arabinose transferase-like glycosyltransferase
MIFDMAFRRTRHGLCSLLVGLTCSLIPEVLVYESLVMTETLTNFFLVTALWLFTRYDGAGESDSRYPLALGSIVALAGLTRPLMICLVPVYYCFLVPPWPPARIFRREAMKKTVFFALPVIVLILGWCGFNYFNNGYFSPTTRAGQQLMDQVDPYVDLAPDRFAVLRDIWLQFRRQGLTHPNGTLEDVYEVVLPEMERRTGKTSIQICHELTSLALYLEIHHPLLCLRRAEQSWIQFWGEPSPDEAAWLMGGKIGLSAFANPLANFLVREVKAAFLLLAFLSVPCALFRLKVFTKLEYLIFALASWCSIFAAFTEFGENRRFCVPFYMLIIYTLLTRGWVWINATSLKGPGATPD